MSDSYNREILSRYGQHRKLVAKQDRAAKKAVERGDLVGVIKSGLKVRKLKKSMNALGSAYQDPKPFKKKKYN
jgi:hypothetical protein